MKNVLIMILLLSASLYADLSTAQVENMVQKIHEKRIGIDLETLQNTKNPFVSAAVEEEIAVVKVPRKKEGSISLHAIMGGKAFINDGWRDINDTVMGYKLKYVGKRGVVLTSGDHIKKLFLHEKKDNFITIEER